MAQDAGWGGGGSYRGAPYGGAPHGGPPGWGGWTPPPPQPGVIPLGPLKLGDVFNGAFATVGRYWKQLFGMGAAVYGGTLVLVGIAVLIAYSAVRENLDHVFALHSSQDPATEDVVPLLTAFGLIWLVALVALAIGTAMMYATVPTILQEAVLGRRIAFGEVWRRAWARVPSVIGTVLLMSLIAVVPGLLMMVAFIGLIVTAITMDSGAGTTVAITVGILGTLATAPLAAWLWVKFSLAPSAVVFEGQGPVRALRRSSQLVRGDWWRIFGITLLACGVAATASYIVQLPFMVLGTFSGAIGGSGLGDDPSPAAVVFAMSGYMIAILLGQLLGQMIAATFPQLVTGLLYVDRRIRTEDLAPVLAEAASVPPQYAP